MKCNKPCTYDKLCDNIDKLEINDVIVVSGYTFRYEVASLHRLSANQSAPPHNRMDTSWWYCLVTM